MAANEELFSSFLEFADDGPTKLMAVHLEKLRIHSQVDKAIKTVLKAFQHEQNQV